MELTDQDVEVNTFKFKKLLDKLMKLKSVSKTSVITLLIPPNEQISKINNMLTNEYSTASNIRNRVNRLGVLSSLTSIQQKLKLYNKIPVNGLVILSGEVAIGDKEKQITISFEPPKTVRQFIYRCDSSFHLEDLITLCNEEDAPIIGVIVLVGEECLFASIQGSTHTVHYELKVNLPKKHGRGGQSKLRFERLAEEARHNYLKKIGEYTTQYYINNNSPNVKNILVAGNGYLVDRLNNYMDKKLLPLVFANRVDVSYGGKRGLEEAIIKGSSILGCAKYIDEINIVTKLFTLMQQDKPCYCYGLDATIECLFANAVETLLLSTDVAFTIEMIKNKELRTKIIDFYQNNEDYIIESDIDKISIIDWLINECHNFNSQFKLISSNTSIGTQFFMGFGGIGAILRFEIQQQYDDDEDDVFID